ncbi:tetratricopeptide repeat protein [Salisaeta longa]|uniref:tetratricopeptide repeat protein n=1 Tax=Salisaeta longa TaxID=503170 RepID=UPI0003B34287|nr:tetratricopeptide repeat protein [Salisaeta longa]
MKYVLSLLRPHRTLAVLICAAALLGGCNLFGSGSLDSADTVDELVADANVAISQGNYDKAVELLETAYEQAPENPEVRIKLSTALYGQAGLNVIDLKELVDYISGLEDDAARSLFAPKAGLQCSLEAAEPDPAAQGYERIALEGVPALAPFIDNEGVINRVAGNIIEMAFAQTEAFNELPADLKASWYTIAAFSNIGEAVLLVYNEAVARGGKLFRDANDSIVFCAPEQTDLDALECEAYRIAEQENLIGSESELALALRFIEDKNTLYGSNDDTGIIPESLQRMITAIIENIDAEDRQECTGNTSAFRVR